MKRFDVKAFDVKAFNEALQTFYKLKLASEPYDYHAWGTNATLTKSVKAQLSKLKVQIECLFEKYCFLDGKTFKVHVANGSGWYPRIPWIGILVDGESPREGVYPVMSFRADHWHIGCIESVANPQGDFSERYNLALRRECRIDALQLEKYGLNKDNHLALMPHIFEVDQEITELELKEAFEKACNIYLTFRKGRSVPMKMSTNERKGKNNTFFTTVKVDEFYNWMKIITDVMAKDKNDSWAFRGHRDAQWKLETTFGREAKFDENGMSECGTHEDLCRTERSAIRVFARELPNEFRTSDLKNLDLLSMMQHYGSKTRLLDFTFSPLAALYFASTLSEKEFAIWAIKLSTLCANSKCQTLDARILVDTESAETLLRGESTNETAGILVVQPKVGNIRLSAQRGLFLMPKNLGIPFERNLKNALPKNEYSTLKLCELKDKVQSLSLIKFVFADGVREDARQFLEAMQVTSRLIFPDLQGLAESVTRRITGTILH